MKKILLFAVVTLTALFANAQNADDLFFSEYVEGSSNNKYIEIFNGTGAAVNLSDYQVILFSNGSSTPGNTITLGDISLANGDVYTIGNSSGTIFTADINSNVTYFNGNDALALKKISTDAYVDIFGCIGEDPGSAWTEGSHSTANKTLVRKKWVTVGITTNPPTGFPTLASEWDVYNQDVSTYLGSHTFDPTIYGSLTLTYPVGNEDVQTGQTINFTWTATDVTTIKFQVWISELGAWEDMEGLTAVDATLETQAFTIPTDAEEGDYKIRIVDVDQAPLTSESGFFHITDVHFAGLDPTYPFEPENGATGVPIDLFTGYLQMYFNERVQVGTGNIYLKRFADDAVIETFDVTDPMKVMIGTEWEGDVYVKISSNLSASTQYYVEVEAGAITDRALSPNSFAGFTGKTTWAFTTGTSDSFTTIYDIQYTTDPSGDSPLKNVVVKTKGIVMFVDNYGFYIQEAAEAWKGIYVSNANSAVSVGDDVTVIGTIVENYGYTQMGSIVMITINSSGHTPFAAISIPLTDMGESYESLWVKVENVTCSTEADQYGEWIITDQTNTGRVDDLHYKYTPTLNEEFTAISGFLYYSFNNFKILPTKAEDIVSVPNTITDKKSELTVGPNPFTNELRISSGAIISDVVILNSVGQVAFNYSGGQSENITIPTADLSNGLYLVQITFADGSVEIQKVVKK